MPFVRASLLAILASAPVYASMCDQAPAALAHLHCQALQSAVIFASDASRAAQASAVVDELAERYARYFGKALPVGAVLEFEGKSLTADAEQTLRQGGARWVVALARGAGELPEALQQQLRTQLKDRSEADIESALKQVQQQLGGIAGANDGVLHRGLRFRIVHAALNAQFWPQHSKIDGYGTPAPDWIDEAVVTLFDSASGSAQRHSQLAVDEAQGPVALAVLQARAYPTHPMLGRGGSGGSVISVHRVDAKDSALAKSHPALEAVRMQAYSHSFAQFLIARDARAFASLYAALADGESFETWLQSDRHSLSLPTTAALEQAWHAALASER